MGHEIEFGDPVPDRIPAEILAEFQEDAVRAVQRHSHWRRLRPLLAPLRSSDVWFTALMVFFGLAITIGLLGGIVYAAVVWPWIGLFVVAPAGVLFVVSLLIAIRTRDRWQGWRVW